MKKLTVAILLLVSTIAGASTAALPNVQGLTLQQRLERYSAHFLGRPYVAGGLGEGVHEGATSLNLTKDTDPLLRYDGFDCTTFVETMMALSFTSMDLNSSEFTDADVTLRLNRIRYYQGRVGFVTRNHMTSTDWIPYNAAAGFIRDITRETFASTPDALKISNTPINRGAWLRFQGFTNVPDSLQISQMPYMEISSLVEHPQLLQQIPDGTILNIVRINWVQPFNVTGSYLDVSHQGYVFHKNGRVVFRNASQRPEFMRVIDSDLEEYLRGTLNSPTIKGINLLGVIHR